MDAGWESLMRVDCALRMIDDEARDIEAPAADLANRIDGAERIVVRVDEPASAPRNEAPVLDAAVLLPLGVAEAVEIARDAYLACLSLLDGESTNGNGDCDASTLTFARGAVDRLRAKEASGLLRIDRLEPTRNVYSSYMGWWEGNRPVLEAGVLTMIPAIGS